SAFYLLAIDRSRQRDIDLIALLAGAFYCFKRCTLLEQNVYGFFNIGFGKLQRWFFDLGFAQITNGYLWKHFEGGRVFKLLYRFAERLMLDIRETGDTQFVLFNRISESAFYCI